MGQENIVTQKGSEYNQASFVGGMNLLLDDTRLQTNQYRIGFDLTNRYDVLDPVLASVKDIRLPNGIVQELVTFGNYIIAFVSGTAWYRQYTDISWTQIAAFSMSKTAPRYWTVAVPVSTTNYVRLAATATVSSQTFPAPNGAINLLNVAGANQGNLPGLLVQDNINQPQFIFLDANGIPTVRVTQKYDEWMISYTDADNVTVAINGDQREYVPIGNCMAWANGILFIVSQDYNSIYRSVSGRPLDFVVNVVNTLATNTAQTTVANSNNENIVIPPFTQIPGGDATTTDYSVGVGGITCIRPLSTGGIFVSAGGANFAVTLNQTPNAPTIFGEYLFNRAFLFNSVCLSDRVIFDTLGDTRFIELTGIRSFNAITQVQNEGKNSPFNATIQGIFGVDTDPIIQDVAATAAILYNNYELYAVNTILGPCIAKYDTINNCWVSFDFQQTGGKAVKIFSKIELSENRLFAITTDNELYTLYVGPSVTTPSFRSIGICSSILWAGSTIKMAHPKLELKCDKVRAIINKITESATATLDLYCNNRQVVEGPVQKAITYETAPNLSSDPLALPDVGSQLLNILWSTPDAEQGWKYFANFTWSNGSFTQFSFEMQELTPANPEYTQGLVT
jgi:hypothetical protein